MTNQTALLPRPKLPVGSASKHPPGWWGVWTVMATEFALFGYLLFSYFYLFSLNSDQWPPTGQPILLLPVIATALLISSSVCIWLCEKMLQKNRRGWSIILLALTIVLGAAFIGAQLYEWARQPYMISTHLYGSIYFTITGVHMAHAAIGLGIFTEILLQFGLGYFSAQKKTGLTIAILYWHFVDAVWLFIFSALYLSPYLLRGGP